MEVLALTWPEASALSMQVLYSFRMVSVDLEAGPMATLFTEVTVTSEVAGVSLLSHPVSPMPMAAMSKRVAGLSERVVVSVFIVAISWLGGYPPVGLAPYGQLIQ